MNVKQHQIAAHRNRKPEIQIKWLYNLIQVISDGRVVKRGVPGRRFFDRSIDGDLDYVRGPGDRVNLTVYGAIGQSSLVPFVNAVAKLPGVTFTLIPAEKKRRRLCNGGFLRSWLTVQFRVKDSAAFARYLPTRSPLRP